MFAAGSLAKGRNLSEILPPPYSAMHNKWTQSAVKARFASCAHLLICAVSFMLKAFYYMPADETPLCMLTK